MKEIQRDLYLSQLKKKMGNGLVKVVAGIRRCGKATPFQFVTPLLA